MTLCLMYYNLSHYVSAAGTGKACWCFHSTIAKGKPWGCRPLVPETPSQLDTLTSCTQSNKCAAMICLGP